MVIQQMPDSTLALLASKRLKVKELIKLAKSIQYNCSAKDVINNQQWVRAFATILADRVLGVRWLRHPSRLPGGSMDSLI